MEASYGQTEAAFGGGNPDDALLVRFTLMPVENKAKSEEENRPIFEETVFIEISLPGNKDEVRIRKMKEGDKARFPRQWAAYERRNSDGEVIEGTLLSEWPQVTRSQVEELRFFNIRTVEQLAQLTDTNAQNLRGAATLKAKAVEYLDKSMSNDELSKKLAEQEKQIAALIAAAEAGDKPKKRGRPKTKAA